MSSLTEWNRQQAGDPNSATNWKIIFEAQRPENTRELNEAWERICRRYWYPLYAFLRQRGHGREKAQDLVQGFFLHLLNAESFQNVSPEKGRFRTFLCSSLQNFVNDGWDRENAIKRGGTGAKKEEGQSPKSKIEFISWEDWMEKDPEAPVHAQHEDPATVFARAWAKTIWQRALQALEREAVEAGEWESYRTLLPLATQGAGEDSYAEVAKKLGLTVTAVKQRIRRVRLRFRELLKAEVAATVPNASSEEIDEEFKFLHRILAG